MQHSYIYIGKERRAQKKSGTLFESEREKLCFIKSAQRRRRRLSCLRYVNAEKVKKQQRSLVNNSTLSNTLSAFYGSRREILNSNAKDLRIKRDVCSLK